MKVIHQNFGNIFYSIVPIPSGKTGTFATNTSCIFKAEINEKIGVQNSQLLMLLTVHLKDEVDQYCSLDCNKYITWCHTSRQTCHNWIS